MSVIRLKRLANEDPAEALIVHYKRRKFETGKSSDDHSESVPSENQLIFQLVGTLDSKNDGSLNDVAKILNDHRKAPKTPNFNAVENLKEKVRETSKVNRYKLVSTLRGVAADAEEDQSPNEPSGLVPMVEDSGLQTFNLYDAENEMKNVENLSQDQTITCNGAPMAQHNFVYDLYYVDGVPLPQHEDTWGHPVCIEGYPYLDLVIETQNESDPEQFEDEDSNSESNWRNDYPDRDPDEMDSDRDSCAEEYGYGENSREYDEDADYVGNYDDDNEYDSCVNQLKTCLIDHSYQCSQISKNTHQVDDSDVDSDEESRFGKLYDSFQAKMMFREN